MIRRAWIGPFQGLLAVSVLLGATVRSSIAQQPPAGMRVWDTVRPSSEPLASAVILAAEGWTRIARNERLNAFQGDAVISNGQVLAAVRKNDAAVDLYSYAPGGPVSRARLRLLSPDGNPAARLAELELVEHTRAAVRWEATYRTADDQTMVAGFRLKRGAVALEVEPQEGASRLHIDCPGRFVVLPDFFADDILIDARKLPLQAIDVPSEHFLLHLTGQGDAIAMCVFENREQDVKVSLSGTGDRRIVTRSEIDFGRQHKVWVALIDGPQIWHTVDVAESDASKVRQLDWTMPFAAQWRIDFTRPNELTDSWEFLLRETDGPGYLKPNWMARGAKRIGADRKRWTTVLGRFEYPCWTDAEGRGYLQPLEHKALSFQGPAVIYPISRVEQTPADAYTVLDVMRNCLGVGPCEYVLKVEGQKQEYQGRATCSARDALLEIYGKNQQKRRVKEVEAALDDALTFVTHIRGRISQYVDFGHEMRRYLARQKAARPELAAFLDEMDQIVREIDARIASRRNQIRTPRYVARMNDDFRKNLLGYEGSDAGKRLTRYTSTLTEIGGNQDELVGECRWIVRSLRQRAGILMALDAKSAGVAEEIRARCQKVLLKPSTYEGVRH